MTTLWRDLHRFLLTWRTTPGLVSAALLNFAVGIGGGLAIFTWINATILSVNPFAQPQRAVYLWSTNQQAGVDRARVALGDFVDWRQQSQSFEGLAAFESGYRTLGGNPPERVRALAVSADFFATVGTHPLLGRTFLKGEDRSGFRAVVLGHRLWQERFGGDRSILGESVALDGEPHAVIGVMPADYWYPSYKVELWSLLDLRAATLDRTDGSVTVVGLLRPGVSLEEARAEMKTLVQRLEQEYPDTHADRSVRVVPISWELLDRSTRTILFLLVVMIFAVLLIACTNVANLLLVRGASRQGELALRVALGSSRGRLIRQLLTESLALALVGGALGLLVGRWGASILLATFPRTTPDPPRLLDARVLGLALILSLVACILSGLVPALRVSRPQPQRTLQEAVVGSGGAPGHRRLYKTLVMGELCITLVLLAASGLLMRTLLHLHRMDVGLETQTTLTAWIDLPENRDSPSVATVFYQQLLEGIESLPGAQTAGATTHLPFVPGAPVTELGIEGRSTEAKSPRALYAAVTPGYLKSLGISVIRGRSITWKDVSTTLPVAVINDTLAHRHWPDEDPLGQRMRLNALDPVEGPERWWTIVGVIHDARTVHPAFEPAPQVYLPHAQSPVGRMALAVRASGNPLAVTPDVRAKVAELRPSLAVYDIQPLQERMRNLLATPRALGGLLGTFAGLSLILAATGVFAVTAYSVRQRTHEIGVRMALGARRRDVLGLVLREGATLLAVGALFGCLLAVLLGHAMSGILYGVRPGDPVTLGAGAVILMGVGLLASWLPARRAAHTPPAEVLRSE